MKLLHHTLMGVLLMAVVSTSMVDAKDQSHEAAGPTAQAVWSFLTALERKDMGAFADVWANDAVQDMPFAPEGFPKQISGKDNIVAHYMAWPDISGDANFTDNLVFYPMANPEWVFVEYQGRVDILTTNRTYEQRYGGLFHVQDGKIVLFREYFDPAPFVYAFDLRPDGASALDGNPDQ